MTKNIFWIDGRSRRSYRASGDVLVFDTTYNTDRYSMTCSPFIGLDHHWISIFFGCALIRDEGAQTFNWLFQTFLKAMRVGGVVIVDEGAPKNYHHRPRPDNESCNCGGFSKY